MRNGDIAAMNYGNSAAINASLRMSSATGTVYD
jgi:hypothetical protein